MDLPVYKLIINPDDETGVEFVSLVTNPAIERDFQYFNKQNFVEPKAGESESDFIGRCIAKVKGEGYADDQAAAICYGYWKGAANDKVSFDYDDTLSTARGKELAQKEIEDGSIVYIISARDNEEGMLSVADKLEIPHSRVYATGSNTAKVEKIKELGIQKHYDNNQDVVNELGSVGQKFASIKFFNDYPKAASQNAQRGINLNEAIGNDCATLVGKNRARQLVANENLSIETIKRTYSYLSRAKEYYNPQDTKACGTISYLLWGGEEMLRWTERKLEELELSKARKAKFEIQNEEKRIISGAAMIADLPIYRYDEIRGEYYVVFDKETIFEIAKKWARGDKYDSVNIHHDKAIKGLSLFESFIVDRERGIMPPKGYEEVADGSWFLSYIVNDDEIWARVKEGEFKGFSVEGMFDFQESTEDKIANAMVSKLKRILEKWDGKN